jgi:excisionase family DNA binding protein
MSGKLLNVKEAAQLLGLKPASLRSWILRRKIEFVRVGRAVRIPPEVIERFIERNTVPAREERR